MNDINKSTDVMDGLAKVRIAFKRANLNPPTVMLLGSHDDGMRFLSEIRQACTWSAVAGSPELGQVVEMADGSIWMECKVMDIAVRWPANKIAKPDGSRSYY